MSMLIVGVNPPKSCYACSWYNKVKCPVDDGRYYYRAQRHPSCPIAEVPTPHGDLIDRDKLLNQVDDISLGYYEVLGVTEDDIDNAPTVIEAEE